MTERVIHNFEKRHGEGSTLRLLSDVNRVTTHQMTWDELAIRWKISKPVLWRTAHKMFDFVVVPKEITLEALETTYHIHSFLQEDRLRQIDVLHQKRVKHLRVLIHKAD